MLHFSINTFSMCRKGVFLCYCKMYCIIYGQRKVYLLGVKLRAKRAEKFRFTSCASRRQLLSTDSVYWR